MPPRYREWLSHVFDHPVLEPAWFFDVEAPSFGASHQELVDLLTYSFVNCGRDLAAFSDGQVNDGLNYIFNPSCSNIAFALMDAKIAPERRKRGIAAITQVYASCFEQRCAPVLSHIDEPGATPLNRICYMLWDVTPLSYWEGQNEKEAFYDEVLDVLSFGLGCRNIASIESALHGLGHIQPYRKEQVASIVRAFIRNNPDMRPDLKHYSENAAIGYVQ
jgi:hypothetical protein